MGKYIFYSGSAALTGCVGGFIIGILLFPYIIWICYGMMYDMGRFYFVFDWKMAVFSLVMALLCSVGVTWYSCRKHIAPDCDIDSHKQEGTPFHQRFRRSQLQEISKVRIIARHIAVCLQSRLFSRRVGLPCFPLPLVRFDLLVLRSIIAVHGREPATVSTLSLTFYQSS